MLSWRNPQSGSMLKTLEAVHVVTHRSRSPPACSGLPQGPRGAPSPLGGRGGIVAAL